jgi:L-alanine-DL-glutamate epimerase-like enolase superfamily enzyme
MKIKAVTAVYPRYQEPLRAWRTYLWQIVVRVETDAGVVGLGYGGGGLAAVEVVNRHFRELLVGRQVESVEQIEAIWDDLYKASLPYGRKGLAIMALSGVDLALWDLLARARDLPVFRLLGARQPQKVRAYATGGDLDWIGECGFTACKAPFQWHGQEDGEARAVAFAHRARQRLGPEALLMFDAYMTWDAAITRQLAAALQAYNIYWFEDVLTPDDLTGQAELRGALGSILLAGGEHEFTHHGFAEIARANALDVWQPDITWCGGLTAFLRIARLAQTAGVRLVPHRGGEAWGLHAIVGTGCCDLAELVLRPQEPAYERLWLGEPQPEAGYLSPSEAPGFGVTVNPALLG